MKKFLGCSVVLMGLLFAGNAFGDGNELLEQCAGAVNYMDGISKPGFVPGADAYFCLGMLQGMIDMNKYYETLLGKNALFCPPESGIQRGQAARIVVKYLKEHPEKLHEEGRFLTLKALVEAFPCK